MARSTEQPHKAAKKADAEQRISVAQHSHPESAIPQ
jgi:hypothetical protein